MDAFAATLHHAYRVAVEAAVEAGRVLRWHFRRGLEIHYKGEIDLVTEADLAAEQVLISRIREAFPDHQLLSEESGEILQRSPWLWVVDPLDGTTNFAHGFPVFSVSIALLHEGQRVLGVVYDVMRDELFAARRGEGAFLNGRPIRVSRTSRLEAALLVTGFPYDRQESPFDNTREFVALLKRCHGVLRVGSAALDLAAVAAGRLDGYWEFRLSPWDLAAGALLVEEAGGRVTTPAGDPLPPLGTDIVATNGCIHEELLEALAAARAGA
ncbi:inositol monophosphatase family protein [Thermoflexus hugenholtzii]|uniref:Inositol-1-monophosphatase n=1 Tax=Thermoflexus hugenholtzii JAD2 TaxID=877466 RepID=A0A212PS11_9CHLR|nr:inositol monophosphatase family protein [Thermoflexus hugenholtzii]SNB49679.1 myo-inositol-1(or 4)-monophosphatase [Thermoflexus hugenholtzii JAD2]